MPTDDYIKRSDAVFAVQKRIEQIGMGNNPYVCSIRQAVRDVPAADVAEVKRGKWIDAYPQKEQNPMFNYGTCSVCGFEQGISNKLNFCPNCGAKMDKEAEDAEIH